MDFEFKPIYNEQEYKEFVERYYYLADGELKIGELLQAQNDHHGLALLLPKFISIVNIVGYLRGQDDRFINLRPHVDFQSELYKKEDEFERRLIALIQFVQSTNSAKLLSDSVSEYYMKNRGL